MTNPLHKIISALLRSTNPAHEIPLAYKELTETIRFYHTTISQHISYYAKLPNSGKLRFLKRVHYFKSSKTFHFTNMEPRQEIPVLVSAAAIQLTFGLRSYHLPFFKNIFILPDAYQTKEFNELVVGHVSVEGIFISWKYFQREFENDKDGVNTALHEMAHALRHQNQLKEFGIDKEFKTDFSKYTQQYGPVLIEALLNRRSFLRGYAFTNFEEFWAVSVEAFFELPAGLKEKLPKIYNALCEVLNQDLILKLLYVLSWIIFIGVCIEAGGSIFSAFYTLVINSFNARTFWVGNDLSGLYEYSRGHFFAETLLISITAVLKACIFYLIIKILQDKKLNMSQPFSKEVGRFIFKISYLALMIGFFSWWGVKYTEWLIKQGVKMPDIQYLRLGGADVWLFMGVTLFVIAQIFKRGIEIQTENELTV